MGWKGIGEAGKNTRFQPGESGNTAGRPAGIPNAKTRLLRWLEIVQEEKNPITGQIEKATIIEMMDAEMIKRALSGDVRAYKEILDRLEGGTKQRQELTGGVTVIRQNAPGCQPLPDDDGLPQPEIQEAEQRSNQREGRVQ